MSTPTGTVPPGLIYATAADYQRRLEAMEDTAAAALRQSWADAHAAIQADQEAFLDMVAARRDQGLPTSPSWAFRDARYQALLATADAQYARYATDATQAASWAQGQAVGLATSGAAATGSAAVSSAGVAASFVSINPDNLRHLVGFLADGSPLADLFAGLGGEGLDGARQVLIHGLVTGRGVGPMRRDLSRALDVPRWRAETIVRTEAHRVYRAASRETYAANADVLEGWVWHATLGPRTCPGCLAMHGTLHPVTETLDGHPRCRCAMVPRTKGWGDLDPSLADLPDTRPDVETGADWLARQDQRTQRAILGPTKYAAYRDGDMDLADMVARSDSPRWGTMRREATLAEAKAAARARRAPKVPKVAAPSPTRWAAQDAEVFDPSHGEAARIAQVLDETRQEAVRLARDVKAARADVKAAERAVRDAWGTDLLDGQSRAAFTRMVREQVDADFTVQQARLRLQWAQESLERAEATVQALGASRRGPGILAADRYARPRPLPGDLPRKADPGSPGSDAFTVNWGWDERTGNCPSVSAAYELRRRGYDVYARRDFEGALRDEVRAAWRTQDGRVPEFVEGLEDWDAVAQEVQSWPHGARGFISVKWDSGGGHIYNVENRDGVPVQIDGQNGSAQVDYRDEVLGRSWAVLRVDDLVPTDVLEVFVDRRNPWL